MTTDHTALRALAEAAMGKLDAEVFQTDAEGWCCAGDIWEAQDYMAAANPAAIKALLDELEAAQRDAASKQARIDSLMLEFCPDEMTAEQIEEWKRHQVAMKGTP